MINDCAVYRTGERRPGTLELEHAVAACGEPDSFLWLALHEPAADELIRVQSVLDLNPQAVEDTPKDHKRPRMRVDGEVLFAVMKTARYAGPDEVLALGHVAVFSGPWFLVSAQYGAACDLATVRKELEARSDLLRHGPCTVVYAILDRVADDYVTVLGELDNDLHQVEQQVFSPAAGQPAERIYRLKREVLEFQRATAPLANMIVHLSAGKYPIVPDSVRVYFGGVEDRLLRVVEEVERDNALLSSMLDANSAQVATRQAEIALAQTRITMRQNEDMRKISAWVAIAAVPTMVAGIYGMNFDHMPELRWLVGYPAVVAAMAGVCSILYWRFRRSGWL